METYTGNAGTIHLLRLDTDGDLYDQIASYAISNNISTATLTFLGAVQRAAVRYYNQDSKQYENIEMDRHLEVVAGVGNISLLDTRPFVHIHMALSDSEGNAFGGHVHTGTVVFAIEVTIIEIVGDVPKRHHDDCTGLALWTRPPADTAG